MSTARDAAPEVDRLVLSLGRRTGREHADRLADVGRAHGLASLDWLSHIEDFARAGRLTRELGLLRSRYWSSDWVLGRFDELAAGGYLAAGPDGHAATGRLLPVLDAMRAARAQVAAAMWGGHRDAVGTVSRLAAQVVAAATPEHELAAVHRSLPEPDDEFLRMDHRLVTLRFVRNHDHAVAWQARGLTADGVVVLTRLWEGGEAGDDRPGALAALVGAGLVAGDPPAITPAGRELRDAIEADTNARAQRSFDALGGAEAAELLAAMRRLPGEA